MEQDEDSLAVRDAARSLRHHWLFIAGVVLIVVAAASFFTLRQSPHYSADTQVVVGPVVSDAAFPAARGSTNGPLGLDLPAETQARIIASPLIGRRVAQLVASSASEDDIAKIVRSTTVKAVTDNAFVITVSAGTAVRAAALANGFANEYLDYRREQAVQAFQSLARADRNQAVSLRRTELADLDAKIRAAEASGDKVLAQSLGAQRSTLLTSIRTLADESSALANLDTVHLGVGEVTSPATPARDAKSPSLFRNLAMAVVLGLVLAIATTLLRDHMSERVSTRDDAARRSNAPVLAAIPRPSKFQRLTRRRRKMPLDSPPDVFLPERDSAEAQAYVELAGRLTLTKVGNRSRTMAVTAVRHAEDSVDITVKLAAMLSTSGLRTALVIARPVDQGTGAGVSDPALHASGGTDRGDTVSPLSPTDARRREAEGPLLRWDQLSRSVADAAESADLVLVAAGSVLGGDALTAAGICQETILVVRVEADRHRDVTRAAAILRQAGSHLVGAVLTHAWPDDDSEGVWPSSSTGPTFWEDEAVVMRPRPAESRDRLEAEA